MRGLLDVLCLVSLFMGKTVVGGNVVVSALKNVEICIMLMKNGWLVNLFLSYRHNI